MRPQGAERPPGIATIGEPEADRAGGHRPHTGAAVHTGGIYLFVQFVRDTATHTQNGLWGAVEGQGGIRRHFPLT